jgi:hypothetical protein
MVNAVRCPHGRLQTVLIAAPGLSVDSLRTPTEPTVGTGYPINDITLSYGEA